MERLEILLTPRVTPGLEPCELVANVVEEKRLDHLENVLLGGVVRALGPALLLVHHRLEQRAEDGGRYSVPTELADLEQQVAHGGVEGRRAQALREQIAVDVRELCEVLVERLLPPF